MTSHASILLYYDVTATSLVNATPPPPPCLDVGGGNATAEAYRFYRVVVDVYVVGALCVAGLFGNLLSIAVLNRDRDKPNATNWLLQTLAVVDTAYLATCVLIQPVKTAHDMTDWFDDRSALRQFYPYVEPHAWAVASIAQTTTVWIVLLVTVDRYIAVCRPLQVNWRSLTRAKVAVVAIVLAAVVYNIPRFLEREVVTCLGGDSIPMHATRKTALRLDRNYFLAYKTVCYFVFRAVGPLVALVLLNVRLIRALRVVRAKRRHLRQKTKHRENLTTMLVVVVSVFIVCQLPDLGIRVAFTCSEFAASSSSSPVIGGNGTVTAVPPTDWLDMTVLRYANAASNALLTLNSAVNFLVYCLVGRKFRRILIYEMCHVGGHEAAAALHRVQQQADTSETELTPHRHLVEHRGGGGGGQPHECYHLRQHQHNVDAAAEDQDQRSFDRCRSTGARNAEMAKCESV